MQRAQFAGIPARTLAIEVAGAQFNLPAKADEILEGISDEELKPKLLKRMEEDGKK